MSLLFEFFLSKLSMLQLMLYGLLFVQFIFVISCIY